MLNPIIKKLYDQTTLNRNNHTTEQRLAEVNKFAQLIIKAILDDPRMYILNKKDNTQPESTVEIHGWTADLKLAQHWRDSGSHHESRDFTDIFFIKHITSL